MRHAKSSWDFELPDDKRPLNQRGLNDASLMAKELIDLIKPIDQVWSSPAKRAHTTAQIVVDHLKINDEVFRIQEDLYDFEGNKVLDLIKNCNDKIDTLMIFGHNHAFTSLVNFLGDKRIDNLPTAGFAEIEFDVDQWKNIVVGKTLLIRYPKMIR